MTKESDTFNKNLKKILKNGRAFFLAYDQGLEHGPIEFNDENVDPRSIIEIARKGRYTGIIFQKGIAEKYKREIRKSKVPLVVKLNGRTNLYEGEPISKQLCTVDEAITLGACAVGYTIYIGSEYEPLMFEEFENIEREAHSKGIPVVAWVYPRGKSIKHKSESELLAYSARVALELGADIVKLKYSGNKESLKWAVKAAGKCKVIFAGGVKTHEQLFIHEVKNIMSSGAAGLAVGRNIWQSEKPAKLSLDIRKIVFR